MRDHDACENDITAALARGRTGFAEYLAARCDRHHGQLATTPVSPVGGVTTHEAVDGGKEEA